MFYEAIFGVEDVFSIFNSVVIKDDDPKVLPFKTRGKK